MAKPRSPTGGLSQPLLSWVWMHRLTPGTAVCRASTIPGTPSGRHPLLSSPFPMGPLPVTTAQHTGRVTTLAADIRWPLLDIFSLIWDLRRMTLPPFLYEEGGGHEVPNVTDWPCTCHTARARSSSSSILFKSTSRLSYHLP